MRLLISGYYGFGNIGDEAILAAMVEHLRRVAPDAEMTVLSGSPEETARMHGVHAIPRANVAAVWRALKACDLFLSGGGSLFQDVSSRRSLQYYTGLLRLARLAGTPYAVFAQGMGPISDGRSSRRLAAQLAGARWVTVRDPEAARQLEAWGFPSRRIDVAADAAHLLKPRLTPRVREAFDRLTWDPKLSGPLIGLSLRPLPSSATDDAARTGRYAKALDHLVTELEARLLFLSMHRGDDDDFAARVAEQMEHGALTQRYTGADRSDWHPAEHLAAWSRVDIAVAMRYHAVLFAVAGGVPAVGVSYDPKVDALMEQLGGDATLARWHPDEAAHTLVSRVGEAAERRESGAAIRERRLSHLREKAEHPFELVAGAAKRQRAFVLGVPIDLISREGARRLIADALTRPGVDERVPSSEARAKGAPYWIVTANPELLRSLQLDGDLRQFVSSEASLVVCDGIGLVWGARRLGALAPERVPGVELAEDAVQMAAGLEATVYVVGGAPGVAKEAADAWRARYPGLRVVGTAHGYFTPAEGEALAEHIGTVAPQLLLVGMGAPKQERWIAAHLSKWEEAGANGRRLVAIGVGGTLDVAAGRVRRAPEWVQRLGLEWLYRLVRQPSRLKRIGALPWFVWRVLAAGRDRALGL